MFHTKNEVIRTEIISVEVEGGLFNKLEKFLDRFYYNLLALEKWQVCWQYWGAKRDTLTIVGMH